ncbi:MAG: stage III sporulation protein AF [Lachnospiraceae bacterium]|nr:stage III sporulation protein AF [Lachnospiraceae bacterium]
MLKTIREIGIFMIAAQAVAHFAPGVRYEKYINSISGVIILFLFLKPFLQLSGGKWEEPEQIFSKMAEWTEMPALPESMQIASATDAVAAQMEEEIRKLLNQELTEENRYVKRVIVRLGEGQSLVQEEQLPFVEVLIGQKEEKGLIVVEEITIGETADPQKTEEEQAYRQRFAGLLGIPEGNVEVRMDGRG